MGVKRHGGKWQVDLGSAYVGVYPDERSARRVFATGEHQLMLGKPLRQVIDELRGRGKPPAPALDTYADRWLASLTVSEETREKYRTNYRRFGRLLGRTRLDRLTPDEVRQAVSVLADSYAPKSVSVSATVLRSMLADAVDQRLIDRSPAARLKNLPKVVGQREPHVLTRKEHKALIAAAPERDRGLVTVWPLLGLRVGEVSGLRTSDVCGDHIIVRRQFAHGRLKDYTKSRKVRRVDLTPQAARILAEQARQAHPGHGLLFPALEGGLRYYGTYAKLMESLRTIVPGLVPHDFRHTFGSWLIRSGADIVYVSARMGHSSPLITMRVYAHEIEDRDTTAIEGFTRWFSGT